MALARCHDTTKPPPPHARLHREHNAEEQVCCRVVPRRAHEGSDKRPARAIHT